MFRKLLLPFAFTAISAVTGASHAQAIAFDGSWKEQGFLRFFTNDYVQRGDALGVRSDGTVSVLYRPVPDDAWGANAANWSWQVSQGVPATDLTKRGGDDRNLAMYFVFADQETAETLNKRSLRRLLRNQNIRVLAYVWGGDATRGDILPSPYLDKRGVTVIRRPAGLGSFSEQVNLDADLKRAFGQRPPALIGVAVSADSDDTDSKISATISGLRLN